MIMVKVPYKEGAGGVTWNNFTNHFKDIPLCPILNLTKNMMPAPLCLSV